MHRNHRIDYRLARRRPAARTIFLSLALVAGVQAVATEAPLPHGSGASSTGASSADSTLPAWAPSRVAAVATDNPAMGQPMAMDALDGMRGGMTGVVGIRGETSGNTANDVVSGSNVIDGGSFANSSGISTVIQNSGSNVLIQNGTVVNIQFVDTGL